MSASLRIPAVHRTFVGPLWDGDCSSQTKPSAIIGNVRIQTRDHAE